MLIGTAPANALFRVALLLSLAMLLGGRSPRVFGASTPSTVDAPAIQPVSPFAVSAIIHRVKIAKASSRTGRHDV
ncbi:hypothetical protein HQ394_02300 [Defluviicoccus vanus]|uniref:Uncharacterized protein n=1 Tax=Defluviicoccus vanus TaxID=111831 RepID=A0A7H1MY69_9PROT|nr:hypothetical protein HQ394_02300 [Defluviicoccus vanus]